MLRVNGLDNFEFMKFINEQNRQRSWKLKFHAKKYKQAIEVMHFNGFY